MSHRLKQSISVHICKSFKHSIRFPRRRRFSRGNKLSRASLSSYDLLRKEGIIFVALRWTASSFAISFARCGDQNCTAYSKCGLTKLLYRGRIISLFLKEKFLFMKPSFTRSLFTLLEEFKIRRNRNTKTFDTMDVFEFLVAHFIIIF